MPPLLGRVVGDGPRRGNGEGSPENQDWAWTVQSGTGDDRYVYVHLKLQCVNLICQNVRSESRAQGRHPPPLKNVNRDQARGVAADEEAKAEQRWVGFLREKLTQLRDVLTQPFGERVTEPSFPEALDPSLGEKSCHGFCRTSVRSQPAPAEETPVYSFPGWHDSDAICARTHVHARMRNCTG